MAIAGLGAGCGPEAPPERPETPTWPEGTVLAVDGLPIGRQEVDDIAASVSLLYPEYTRPHLRRLALTNRILPLTALKIRHAEGHAASRTAAEEALAELGAGRSDPEDIIAVTGGWRELGFELWSAIATAPMEVWIGPVELPGRFVLVKLHQRPPAEQAQLADWRLSILEYPYLSQTNIQQKIDAALDQSVLTVIEATWNEVVPESWKHRMSGGG